MRAMTLLTVLVAVGSARADKVVLVAGGGTGGDGSKATEAKVVQPFSVAFDTAGNTLFVEMNGGERFRQIGADGKLTTLAGTGKKGRKIGLGSECEFNGMHDLAFAPDGTVFLADTFNNQIHRYDPKTKTVAVFAGNGKKGFAGDGGKAADAEFNQTICIALTPDGKTLYVADIGNKRVRAIDVTAGTVSTVAGTGKAGVPKDGGLAKDEPLVDPRALTADAKGNVYILERGGHALRVVDKDGKIRTVAGTGKAGKGTDGPALQCAMNGPKYAAMDKDGSVLIADTENHQIRRFRPDKGTMELVAGTGKAGKAFDADPTKLELARPHGVTVHPKTGEIYIADSDNGRIVKLTK